jgi:hypothetical protein
VSDMSIRYRINSKIGVTIAVWSGKTTADEILAHVQRLVDDPLWPPPRRLQLGDLRRGTSLARMDDATLQKAANILGGHLDKIVGSKIAFVASAAFEKTSTFKRYMSIYPLSIIVFNSLDTACTWLGIDLPETERTIEEIRIAGKLDE